jgi:hypothetical protein
MIRLTLAGRFVDEAAAEREMSAYSLWTIGARIVPDAARFRIVIDTLRPRGVQRYLATHMPSAAWDAAEIPE